MRKQSLVSLSVGEAEVYAAVAGAADGLYYREIFGFPGLALDMHQHLDSSSTKCTMAKLGGSKRTRHMEVRALWLQGLQGRAWHRTLKVHTSLNPVDLLTKPMAPPPEAMRAMGLRVGNSS